MLRFLTSDVGKMPLIRLKAKIDVFDVSNVEASCLIDVFKMSLCCLGRGDN